MFARRIIKSFLGKTRVKDYLLPDKYDILTTSFRDETNVTEDGSMKKVLPFVLITLLIACLTLALCACGETGDPVSAPVIRSYRLNDQGHFIAVYEGGETKDLGDFSQTIASNIDSISVSFDDYYVVDGIKTSIRAHQPYAYSIDKDAHLVAHFADGTTQDLGDCFPP